jgi:broad specificity phosphatase PhoE
MDMHLIIVRHGQSTGNITTADVPDGVLTAVGRQQARETAAVLAREGITHVLSSPLVRALATATAIADAAGIDRIDVWPELQEHRVPLHRGLGHTDLLRDFPKAVFADSFEATGWDHGGETYETALDRGASALAALRARHQAGDRVVVATHGAFGCYLLRELLHMPRQFSAWFRMNNCGVSRIAFIDSRPDDDAPGYETAVTEVISVNEISHLSTIS